MLCYLYIICLRKEVLHTLSLSIYQKGEMYMRKFTKTAICNIRHAINVENHTRSSIAQRYNVSPSTISDIASGRTYQDVPEAKAIPGFSNYLAYPNGKVWSFNTSRFVKPVQKNTASKVRYINLHNRNSRRSMQVSHLISSLF